MKQVRIRSIIVEDEEQEYVPVEKWFLETGDTLECDLFIGRGMYNRKELLLAKSEPLDAETQKKTERVEDVYIRREDLPCYHRFVDRIAKAAAENPDISASRKSAIVYRQASIALDEMFENPEAPENVAKSKDVVDNIVSTIMSNPHAIKSLFKITAYDYYTHTHSINVCIYALSLGASLGLKGGVLDELGMSALLHDLGKSLVDREITIKKGPLSPEEFEQMKLHPIYGYMIALKLGIKDRLILDGIRHHHEKLDGSGYPDRLSGEEITLFARIIGVCDVFDALSTNRPYRERLNSFESLHLMKETMRNHLDMRMVDAFVLMQAD